MSGRYEMCQYNETDSQSDRVFGVRSSLSQALGAVFPGRQIVCLVVGIQQLVTVTQSDLQPHRHEALTLKQSCITSGPNMLCPLLIGAVEVCFNGLQCILILLHSFLQ